MPPASSSSSSSSAIAPSSSAPPSATFPSILQHIAPVVPTVAVALLALCALRAVFRKCQRRVKLLQRQQQLGATSATATDLHNHQLNPNSNIGDASELDRHAITPWELSFGIDPHNHSSPTTSPLFLLQHPADLLHFPHPFAYPPFPPFFLFHPSDGQMVPPTYEDALKLPPPPGTTTTGPTPPPPPPPQPLCVPSLAVRARMAPSEQSPPPCYEQVEAETETNDGEQQQSHAADRLFIQRRAHPPPDRPTLISCHSASAEDLSNNPDRINGSAISGDLLNSSDRPCSSCSLVDDAPQSQRRLGTFVAKSARKRNEAKA